MKSEKRAFLIKFAYLAIAVWIIIAGSYIATRMRVQFNIFSELRSIVNGDDGCEDAAASLGERDRLGLLYVLQELQQDPDRNPHFRSARGFEKLGGRFHPPLTQSIQVGADTEKGAVRSLMVNARNKLMAYVEQVYYLQSPEEGAFAEIVKFNEIEREILRRYSSIMRKLNDERMPEFADLLDRIADGENTTDEDAQRMREDFDQMTLRIERWVAGEALQLIHEELAFYQEIADVLAQYLSYELKQTRRAGEEIDEVEDSEGLVAAIRAEVVDADRMNEMLAARIDDPSLVVMRSAVTGFIKLSGQARAPLTTDPFWYRLLGAGKPGEITLVRNALPNHSELPVEKITKLLDGDTEVSFTPAEDQVILAAADHYMNEYRKSEVRLAEVILRQIQSIKANTVRFQKYPILEEETIDDANVFRVIASLWRRTEDRVMIIDMIDISGNPNDKVRLLMQDALVEIGKPTVETLTRSIGRQRIDQALAADTSDRIKAERLRELNEVNTIIRLACLEALYRIEGAELREFIRGLVDDRDPVIARRAVRIFAEIER